MKYVLDTNVISEITKPQPNQNALFWIQDHVDDVGITSISLEKLYYGILLLPDGKRKRKLKETIDAVVRDCSDRTLSFDAFCSFLCADIRSKARKAGRVGTIEDFMIAAICLRDDLALVTRNVKDFDFIDNLEIVNPFEYESPTYMAMTNR